MPALLYAVLAFASVAFVGLAAYVDYRIWRAKRDTTLISALLISAILLGAIAAVVFTIALIMEALSWN